MGELIPFPIRPDQTPDQLWFALELHERQAERIRRILGMLGIERGLSDDE
jgi:hypothetical protein